MMEMFNDEERRAVMEQYQSMLPSLDMKQAFQPRAPELTTFKVKPCDMCGGHLEITVNVSEELQELRAQIEHQKKVEERLRLDHATQSYQFEKVGYYWLQILIDNLTHLLLHPATAPLPTTTLK